MAFYVGGVHYVSKMTTDLSFLPVPAAQDPLLLHWFGEQIPWLLESNPELAHACSTIRGHLSTFDVNKGVDNGPSDEALQQLATAQKDLLAQAAKNGSLLSPEALKRTAHAPVPAGADHADPGQRWQYSAFQTVIYGDQVYADLLQVLPAWFDHRAISDAAVTVQQMYKSRLLRKFARARRHAAERKVMMDNIARAKRSMRAAIYLQGRWRTFLLRRAMKDAHDEARVEKARRHEEREVDKAIRKAARDQQAKEEMMVLRLQRMWQVRNRVGVGVGAGVGVGVGVDVSGA